MIDATLMEKLSRIRVVALDVDGVLTDGGVYVLDDGSEFRRFNIKDGQGIKRLLEAGIRVYWISSGTSQAIQHRANALGVTKAFLGVRDKASVANHICTVCGIEPSGFLYIGDDLVDLAVLRFAGVACAPLDSSVEVHAAVDYITQTPGGQGAVREVCDLLMEIRQSAIQQPGNKAIW